MSRVKDLVASSRTGTECNAISTLLICIDADSAMFLCTQNILTYVAAHVKLIRYRYIYWYPLRHFSP